MIGRRRATNEAAPVEVTALVKTGFHAAMAASESAIDLPECRRQRNEDKQAAYRNVNHAVPPTQKPLDVGAGMPPGSVSVGQGGIDPHYSTYAKRRRDNP